MRGESIGAGDGVMRLHFTVRIDIEGSWFNLFLRHHLVSCGLYITCPVMAVFDKPRLRPAGEASYEAT